MLKQFQSKNMRQPSNLAKIIIVVSLLAIITCLMFIFVSAANASFYPAKQEIRFTNDDIYSLYSTNNVKEENTFLVRYEINEIIASGEHSVIDFYSEIAGNRYIAQAIIDNAIANDVPVNVAFSVAWKESRFNHRAINSSNSNGSADWGLFQLNDNYTHYTRDQFFDIELNSHRGTNILGELIDRVDGNVVTALYCYNAGHHRVVVQGIVPSSTQRYAIDILEYEDMLNIRFNEWLERKT